MSLVIQSLRTVQVPTGHQFELQSFGKIMADYYVIFTCQSIYRFPFLMIWLSVGSYFAIHQCFTSGRVYEIPAGSKKKQVFRLVDSRLKTMTVPILLGLSEGHQNFSSKDHNR